MLIISLVIVINTATHRAWFTLTLREVIVAIKDPLVKLADAAETVMKQFGFDAQATNIVRKPTEEWQAECLKLARCKDSVQMLNAFNTLQDNYRAAEGNFISWSNTATRGADVRRFPRRLLDGAREDRAGQEQTPDCQP